ncbi:MAG: K+-transporting ATPase, c chain, partial [Chloroflexota bacterium]|nr:K+-transporting ATPase, c chain [Chloroflexota bacterium]
MLRRQLVTGLLMTIVLTVLLGFAYPLAVTGISQLTMSKRAN